MAFVNKSIICSCLILLVLPLCHGQSDPAAFSSLHLSAGAIHHRLIDEAFTQSRLKLSGTPFTASIGYQKKAEDKQLTILLQFGGGVVSHRTTDVNARINHLLVAVAYQKKIADYHLLGKECTLLLGPQLGKLDYALSDEEVLENVSVTFNTTFGLQASQVLNAGEKSTLEMSWAMPVVALSKRAAYDGGANTTLEDDFTHSPGRFLFAGSRISLVNPLHLTSLRCRYTTAIGSGTSFSLSYQFGYVTRQGQLPVNAYSNGLLAALQFRLRSK